MSNENLISEIHSYGLNQKTREIYLHGHYGEHDEEPGVEYRMATTFVKNLHYLQCQNDSEILVHMHTIGGNWHDGMGIYNAIQFSPCHITILAYASVSSMSSIVLQAADTRILMPDSEFMIHLGSLAVDGHSLTVESNAEQNKKSNDRMLDIYTEKCVFGGFFQQNYKSNLKNRTKKYLIDTINKKGDWYMSAAEAVDYGFADAVLGDSHYKDLNNVKSR